MIPIILNFGGLRQTHWREFAIRFVLGGAITALVGVIGKAFGPGIGGLFLAFPAIFPASATLVEKHELKKKQRAGVSGTMRSREIAGADAAGASMASLGLLAFAVFVYKTLPSNPAWIVLITGAVIWLAVSVAVWRLCREL